MQNSRDAGGRASAYQKDFFKEEYQVDLDIYNLRAKGVQQVCVCAVHATVVRVGNVSACTVHALRSLFVEVCEVVCRACEQRGWLVYVRRCG